MQQSKIKLLTTFFVFSLLTCLQAQDTSNVRVMSYNLLNYAGDDSKAIYYQTVLNEIEPDVIVAQEVVGSSGYNQFLSEVLNTDGNSLWSGAPFTNQSANQDIALYYKKDKFTFISTALATTALSSGLRAVVEFSIEHNTSGSKINFYGLHFKASKGSDNAAKRKTEATLLRNYLNNLDSSSYFLVCGDFNIYGSGEVTGYSTFTEEVYPILTDTGNDSDGQVVDPLDAPGMWNNNSSFSWLHTQSTRTGQLSDGGSSGGLDDRFDLILFSKAFFDTNINITYIDESYTSFGNDGFHFNKSINERSNSVVNSAVAEALYQASDHLPLYADIRIVTTSVSIVSEKTLPEVFSLGKPFPNPFNPRVSIPYKLSSQSEIDISIYDLNGRLVETLYNEVQSPGVHFLSWYPSEAPSGVYFIRLMYNGEIKNRKIVFMK